MDYSEVTPPKTADYQPLVDKSVSIGKLERDNVNDEKLAFHLLALACDLKYEIWTTHTSNYGAYGI